jgi:acetyl-CoA acetyltransferase
MIPMTVDGTVYVTDQGIRPDTSLDLLAQLRPAFEEGGTVTAGNSSQVLDGAATVLLMSAGTASELGLAGRARTVDHATVGCDPVKMLEVPIPATAAILERNGLTIGDIDRFEINEAFARRSPRGPVPTART